MILSTDEEFESYERKNIYICRKFFKEDADDKNIESKRSL